jgi:N-acetylglucosamine-1-phosphodiester alpha-N-acetylglucosaminidase
MTFFLLLTLIIATTIVLGLERPSLKNLKSSISVDFDTIKFDPDDSTGFHNWHIEGKYNSTGRPYSAYVAIFPASKFSFYPPVTEGCKKLVQTSVSSSTTYDCEYATNGAFFTWDMPESGSLCIGNLVSDGKIWQLPTDGSGTKRANLGLTSNNEVQLGFVDSTIIANTNYTQLITGWGWLVRNGVNNVNVSQDLSYQPGGFTLEKAPRTSVGVFANGTMILLEIDGEEDINAGPDLFEVAELLVSLNVYAAVNIDGGGSSVSVKNGQVVSQPTCDDTPKICERAVASIACVRR